MNTESGSNMPAKPRDAIIFIPGLGSAFVNQSIDSVGNRILNALDRNARSGDAKFLLGEGKEEDYALGNYKTNRRTITRRDAFGETPLVDIYELRYTDTLTRSLSEKSPLAQFLSVSRVLISHGPRVIKSFRRGAKSLSHQLQMWWVAIMMIMVGIYLLSLLGAVAGNVSQFAEKMTKATSEATISTKTPAADIRAAGNSADSARNAITPAASADNSEAQAPQSRKMDDVTGIQQLKNAGQWCKTKLQQAIQWVAAALPAAGRNMAQQIQSWIQWCVAQQWFVVLVAAIGLMKKESLGATLSRAGQELVCASDYIATADRKLAIVGQLSALLEHITEKDIPYRKIHVVSYSFGSLVAIDAIFPHLPPGKRFEKIDTFVTLGCPFDLVRTYWPDYFKGRVAADNGPKKWINVYTPADVLGSNFRDDQNDEESTTGVVLEKEGSKAITPANLRFSRGVELASLSPIDLFFMAGLKVHNSYFGDEEDTSLSCFDILVPHIFDTEAALA